MLYDCWRGMVGIIQRTKGSGFGGVDPNAAEWDRGDSAVQRRATWQDRELRSTIPAYEEKIAVPLKASIRRQAPMISSQEWRLAGNGPGQNFHLDFQP
jgi:hypothetical protein